MSAELPDWVQPGQQVMVVSSHAGATSLTAARVERHTKTLIVLDNGLRFKNKEGFAGGAYPETGPADYGPYRRIIQPGSAEVTRIMYQNRVKGLTRDLKTGASDLPFRYHPPTAEEVAEIERTARALRSLLEQGAPE